MAASVLIIAPHPDDEAIGCGGAISLHRQRGDSVRVAVLTSGECGIAGMEPERVKAIREAETLAAARVLGVDGVDFLHLPDSALLDHIDEGARRLAALFAAARPGLVYFPHEGEAHLDHQAVLPMLRKALALETNPADAPGSPELRAYEVWTPMERFGWPEDITPVMAKKLAAIRCYVSQLATFRYDRAARGLGAYRGVLAGGCRYAEVFRYTAP